MAIDGPAGSGKTFTALTFAAALANGGGIAVIDTERGSASKYSDFFTFDVLELDTFHPQLYIDGIRTAEEAGYDVIVIDSLSHAWEGEGGVLDLHEQATKRQRTENSFAAWKDVTPIHRRLVDAILGSRCHVVVTMRSKIEYVQIEENGRKIVKKVGMAPVQRQGVEYEFDIVADMDIDHNMVISKSRCFAVADAVVSKPNAQWFARVKEWLQAGAPAPEPAPKPESEPAPARQAQAWTSKSAYIDRLHGFIEQEAARLGLQFPIDGPESAYERIKGEQFGIEHLTEYTGSPEEFKAGIEAWFAAEVERQIADKPKEAA